MNSETERLTASVILNLLTGGDGIPQRVPSPSGAPTWTLEPGKNGAFLGHPQAPFRPTRIVLPTLSENGLALTYMSSTNAGFEWSGKHVKNDLEALNLPTADISDQVYIIIENISKYPITTTCSLYGKCNEGESFTLLPMQPVAEVPSRPRDIIIQPGCAIYASAIAPCSLSPRKLVIKPVGDCDLKDVIHL